MRHQLAMGIRRCFHPRTRAGRLRLHGILFLATFASTFLTQFLATGRVVDGVSYAFAIMGILSAHEMGHYLACCRYGIPATLPFFIPFPFSLFGTLGAVIRMRGPIYSRRALFDIAAAGPLAGLAVALPVLVVGLQQSTVITGVSESGGGIYLGEPLIMRWLIAEIFGSRAPGEDILLHPIAYAGWAGLFVTALNLIPAGQLDGGHVIHAMLGSVSRWSRHLFVVGLVVLAGATGFWGWAILATLIALFGPHPPTREDGRPLEPGRFVVGLFLLAVFVVSFTPVPIVIK